MSNFKELCQIKKIEAKVGEVFLVKENERLFVVAPINNDFDLFLKPYGEDGYQVSPDYQFSDVDVATSVPDHFEKFKVFEYENVKWIETGVLKTDSNIANLSLYQIFMKKASKRYQNLYLKKEDENYHYENGLMVLKFVHFLMEGGKSEDFTLSGKKVK